MTKLEELKAAAVDRYTDYMDAKAAYEYAAADAYQAERKKQKGDYQ
jgi:hypothetical protein